MTKRLEEVLNLPPMKDVLDSELEEHIPTKEESLEKSVQILKALSHAEKVDHALATVTDLEEHDEEMDEISREALEAYQEIKELAMNMTDLHSGKMMEVAVRMLETALEARDRKANRKLKTIELQMRKLKLDREAGEADENNDPGIEFDRNEILKRLTSPRKNQE
jgi:hypothetical protein